MSIGKQFHSVALRYGERPIGVGHVIGAIEFPATGLEHHSGGDIHRFHVGQTVVLHQV